MSAIRAALERAQLVQREAALSASPSAHPCAEEDYRRAKAPVVSDRLDPSTIYTVEDV